MADLVSFLVPAFLIALNPLPTEVDKPQIEVVDNSGPSKYSSMRVDRSGNIHIAYTIEDGNRFPLKYAFWDHYLKHWFLMQIAEGAAACSLTLDSHDRPHISFVDFGTSPGTKLRYAHWDGAAWQVQPIPLNSNIISYYNSIALDKNDRPAISFYEYRGAVDTDFHIRLRVVTFDGESWQVRTVDPQEGSGKFNSLAIDLQGHLHLAYANVSAMTESMRYAFWDGKSWTLEMIDGKEQNSGQSVGYSASIVLDKYGSPHVSYMSESSPAVKYASRVNSHWLTETIDTLRAIGYPDRNSVYVDDSGRVFVGYYDAGSGILKLACKEAGKWRITVVDNNRSGFNSSIQMNGDNLLISYASEGEGSLKLARIRVPPVPKTPDGHSVASTDR